MMHGRTLRTQVLVLVLGLLATVCAVISVTTDLTLRQVLLNRLDSQLLQADRRTAGSLQPPNGQPDDGPGRNGSPERAAGPAGTSTDLEQALRSQGPGTLVARGRDGVFTALVSSPDGDSDIVPVADLPPLDQLPTDGRPHELEIAGESYRALARSSDDGDVVVTALPTASAGSTLDQLVLIQLVVTAVALLLAALAATGLIRLALRPLSRVATTARSVAILPLDRGEVDLVQRVPAKDTDPRTEVGQVGAALNSLLGNVADALSARHASEQRLRRFAADASHELRTPLASIRGYAELSRRADEPVPAPVGHALSRIESEAVRMTSLVEDLLLLARLDAGRPLSVDPVDLSRLVVDAVGDARAAGQDHDWHLELPPDPVTVTGDQARLHQVVANLLANARTHTPAGTTVTTRVATDQDGAELTVLDDGPGVPPELRGEVFERFSRGDTSRSRSSGSTGLGLAIVSAVVQAHGGHVRLDSRPGATAFHVTLPF